jgi:hypothetical protein
MLLHPLVEETQLMCYIRMQEAAKEASEAAHLAGLQAQMAAKQAALERQRTERLAAGAAARSALVSTQQTPRNEPAKSRRFSRNPAQPQTGLLPPVCSQRYGVCCAPWTYGVPSPRRSALCFGLSHVQ